MNSKLTDRLLSIDARSYPAYKSIKGAYDFGDFVLHIEHVQGDPFAAPSRLRAEIPLEKAGFPEDLTGPQPRRLALCHVLAKGFADELARHSGHKGSGKSGLLFLDRPGQQILATTAMEIRGDRIHARFFAGLPAAGRRVLGRRAVDMLCQDLPRAVESALFSRNLDLDRLRQAADCNEDAWAARRALDGLGLVAFVADGAILPRRSGVDDRPMNKGAVPFESPASLRVTLELPHAGRVTGMGIPKGVTLIVGGGFHGKSTLLQAIERGVYDHEPGDGRQLVVTDSSAVKVRAEDGRSVASVDISAFISNLPSGHDTRNFSTQNASGSTSQATNIVEAVEAGTKLLLLDEDTSATNFMIRDERMQRLISKDHEPITPFVDKVRQMHRDLGVSTILVMGGSGDYFDVADTVIAMERYVPKDVTKEARRIAAASPTQRTPEGGGTFGSIRHRTPLPASLDPRKGRKAESVKSRGTKTVLFGTEEIDMTAVPQLVHPGQLRAVGRALLKVKERADGKATISEILDWVEENIRRQGLTWLGPAADLHAFRRQELAAALDRLRTLRARVED